MLHRLTWDKNFPQDEMVRGYLRLNCQERFVPPFTLSGTVTLHEVMDPAIF